ncbi:MAG: STAS domain-containing protein [Actinomycetota bacterium]
MRIDTRRDGGLLTVELAGEMDANNAGELVAAVRPELAADVGRIEVRVAELGFIDSSGISALLELHAEMVERGGSLAVVDPTAPVRRVLEITGLTEAFQL